VESDHCAAFKRSYEKKELVTVNVKSTLADGLAVSTMGSRSFKTALPNVDRVVTVRYCTAVVIRYGVYHEVIIIVRMILLLQY